MSYLQGRVLGAAEAFFLTTFYLFPELPYSTLVSFSCSLVLLELCIQVVETLVCVLSTVSVAV